MNIWVIIFSLIGGAMIFVTSNLFSVEWFLQFGGMLLIYIATTLDD